MKKTAGRIATARRQATHKAGVMADQVKESAVKTVDVVTQVVAETAGTAMGIISGVVESVVNSHPQPAVTEKEEDKQEQTG